MNAPRQKVDRCRLCGAASHHAFSGPVLGHPVDYFDCAECGYLQTETPHWLERAYSVAINDVDTGIMVRNIVNARRVMMTLWAYGRLEGRVVDHAGGYGILVRLLRDRGVNAFWRDKYCDNLLARGFEAGADPVDLLTAFEVFEHLEHPLEELKALLDQAPIVLISTDLLGAVPDPQWWYLGPEHGQHIGFFRERTLAWMARAVGCHYASNGQHIHVFSRQPVPGSWRALQRAQRLAGLLVGRRLHSLTMQDFDTLRHRRSAKT